MRILGLALVVAACARATGPAPCDVDGGDAGGNSYDACAPYVVGCCLGPPGPCCAPIEPPPLGCVPPG